MPVSVTSLHLIHRHFIISHHKKDKHSTVRYFERQRLHSHNLLQYNFLFFKRFYLFFGRVKGKEKGGEKHQCVRDTLIGCLSQTPAQLGTWPAAQVYALTRNQTNNFSPYRTMPNPLSHISQGCFILLLVVFNLFLCPTYKLYHRYVCIRKT